MCVVKLKNYLRKRKCGSQKLELIPTRGIGRKAKRKDTLRKKGLTLHMSPCEVRILAQNVGTPWFLTPRRGLRQEREWWSNSSPAVLVVRHEYRENYCSMKSKTKQRELSIPFVPNCKWVSTSSPKTPRFHTDRNPTNLLKMYNLVYEGTSPCSNDSLGFLLGLEVYFKPAMTLFAHS